MKKAVAAPVAPVVKPAETVKPVVAAKPVEVKAYEAPKPVAPVVNTAPSIEGRSIFDPNKDA